jgi:hypothetical protein
VNQLAHQAGVPHGHLHGDGGTHAEAEEIDLLDAQGIQEPRHVIHHLLVAERALDIGGAAVGLHLRRDDLARLRQERQQRAKPLKRAHAAVQDQQWRVRARPAVDFVIHTYRRRSPARSQCELL